MYTVKKMPTGFHSLDTLKVCSNKITGKGFLFSLWGELPLIIGAGEEPMVWLKAIQDAESKKLFLLVDENISTVKDISVTKPDEGIIEIFYKSELPILKVKKIDSKSAEIYYLDLKPLGFNIKGDQKKLMVGGSSFSNNTFNGSGIFMSLG